MARLNKNLYRKEAIEIAARDFGIACKIRLKGNYFLINAKESDEFANYVLGTMKNNQMV